MKLPIYGFGIGGFRSFSGVEQPVGPLKKINVFIGKNNSGKSNVLRFIRKVYWPCVHSGSGVTVASAYDQPQPDATGDLQYVSLLLPVAEDVLAPLLRWQNAQREAAIAETQLVLTQDYLGRLPGFTWIPVAKGSSRAAYQPKLAVHQNFNAIVNTAIRMELPRGSDATSAMRDVATAFARSFPLPQTLAYIRATRRIPTRVAEFQDELELIGTATPCEIDTLAAWKDPEPQLYSDRKKFEIVKDFLCEVLERSVSIEITHSKTAILVVEYGRRVPLEALGTGVHQLIIFAVQALMHDQAVICLEEPEQHLHPHLQRKLMQFLESKTTNQYFVTTHSPSIMEAVDAAVFHVEMKEGRSTVALTPASAQRFEICRDLGFKPSDLLQANCVVWVEGPSDRRYLLWWLSHTAPELHEGKHFSIMFYGGRLLNHLSVDEEHAELESLIELLPINRHPCVILDRDRSSSADPVNATKQRVIDECDRISAFSWLTAGREIENYVSNEQKQKAIEKIYGSNARLAAPENPFASGLGYYADARSRKLLVADKMRVAKEVTKGTPSLCELDIDAKLQALINYIRAANPH